MAFDIDRFAEESTSLHWEDLGLDALREDPLPPETLRTLRYMCDVEFHTVCYLRDMLVSPSRKDPEVSTFMTMWNREEFWHGEALAHVLSLHGITVAFDELKAKRVKLGWRDRINPVKQSLLSNIVGTDFVAVHMLWGAVNERSAAAAYRRLAALEDHPVLAPLLRRIAAQETKHIAFYTTQARSRPAARRCAGPGGRASAPSGCPAAGPGPGWCRRRCAWSPARRCAGPAVRARGGPPARPAAGSRRRPSARSPRPRACARRRSPCPRCWTAATASPG